MNISCSLGNIIMPVCYKSTFPLPSISWDFKGELVHSIFFFFFYFFPKKFNLIAPTHAYFYKMQTENKIDRMNLKNTKIECSVCITILKIAYLVLILL